MINIAILDSNVLTGLGLWHILKDMIPVAEITVLQKFESLEQYEEDFFAHYFVSSRIYFEHTQFFRDKPRKSIVLVNGDMSIAKVTTINVCQSESGLVRDLLSIYSYGHGSDALLQHPKNENMLSSREIEVAVLLSKGMINKEVADKLNISMTTVVSHRKNIMEKLQARSLADIIIYLVMNGLVDVGEL